MVSRSSEPSSWTSSGAVVAVSDMEGSPRSCATERAYVRSGFGDSGALVITRSAFQPRNDAFTRNISCFHLIDEQPVAECAGNRGQCGGERGGVGNGGEAAIEHEIALLGTVGAAALGHAQHRLGAEFCPRSGAA